MGHRVAPAPGPRVEVRQVGESARGKEGVTDILDGALDAPFLGAPEGPARLGGEVIVTAEFKQAWMEVKGVAIAFKDDGLKIVILMCPTSLCAGAIGSASREKVWMTAAGT